MTRSSTRILALLFVLAAAARAHAADDATRDQFVQTVYAGMENSVRQEFESAAAEIPRMVPQGGVQAEKILQSVRLLYYNKAALFAFCVADAEEARSQNARRLPAEHNLMLTTCVDQKFGEMNDFSNKMNFAAVFFADRIERCSASSRLPDRERLLPPYQFLTLTEPRLYDFALYNKCLMTSN